MMQVFNPAFEREVRGKRAEEARRQALVAAPPLDALPVPVHAVFRGDQADALRRVACARGESPAVLAAAIVARALANGEAETMLANERAEALVSGHGRRPVGEAGDLTLKQCAVLYLVGLKGGRRHWCGWSATALARLMPGTVSAGNVREGMTALAARGLIVRGRAERGIRPARLTGSGDAVWSELAGDFGEAE